MSFMSLCLIIMLDFLYFVEKRNWYPVTGLREQKLMH